MTENEMEMIRIIRSSKDPAKAMEVALDMLPAARQVRAWRVSPQAMG